MTEQEQNEMICLRLLMWKPIDGGRWLTPDGAAKFWPEDRPTFTTWAEAGLILEALAARGVNACVVVVQEGASALLNHEGASQHVAPTGPLALKSATLSYLQATASNAGDKP